MHVEAIEFARSYDAAGAEGYQRGPRHLRGGLVFVLILVVTGAFGIRHHVAEVFRIEHESMEPNLHGDERVLVEKLSGRAQTPERGDVVVLRSDGHLGSGHLVKRVVGLAGDTVEGRDGRVMVDGEPLSEPYLPNDAFTVDFGPTTVPDGTYFVLGDNRAVSVDSRAFGSVDERRIVGRVVATVWPVDPARLIAAVALVLSVGMVWIVRATQRTTA